MSKKQAKGKQSTVPQSARKPARTRKKTSGRGQDSDGQSSKLRHEDLDEGTEDDHGLDMKIPFDVIHADEDAEVLHPKLPREQIHVQQPALWKAAVEQLDALTRQGRTASREEIEFAQEARPFCLGCAVLRFMGPGEIHGVVETGQDPELRHNPRELSVGHLNTLSETFVKQGVKDRPSPVRIMVDKEQIPQELRLEMSKADPRDPESQLPTFDLIREHPEEERLLEMQMVYCIDEDHRLLNDNEWDKRYQTLRQLRSGRKLAKLINGNHRINAMLNATKLLRSAAAFIVNMERNGSERDVALLWAELNEKIATATYAVEVYSSDTPDHIVAQLAKNEEVRPTLAPRPGEAIWTYVDTQEALVRKMINEGKVKTRAEALDMIHHIGERKENTNDLGEATIMALLNTVNVTPVKQESNEISPSVIKALVSHPTTYDMLVDTCPVLWFYNELLKESHVTMMRKDSGGAFVAHVWLSLRLLVQLANCLNGVRFAEALTYLESLGEDTDILPLKALGAEDSVPFFNYMTANPQAQPQLLNRYGGTEAKEFEAILSQEFGRDGIDPNNLLYKDPTYIEALKEQCSAQKARVGTFAIFDSIFRQQEDSEEEYESPEAMREAWNNARIALNGVLFSETPDDAAKGLDRARVDHPILSLLPESFWKEVDVWKWCVGWCDRRVKRLNTVGEYFRSQMPAMKLLFTSILHGYIGAPVWWINYPDRVLQEIQLPPHIVNDLGLRDRVDRRVLLLLLRFLPSLARRLGTKGEEASGTEEDGQTEGDGSGGVDQEQSAGSTTKNSGNQVAPTKLDVPGRTGKPRTRAATKAMKEPTEIRSAALSKRPTHRVLSRTIVGRIQTTDDEDILPVPKSKPQSGSEEEQSPRDGEQQEQQEWQEHPRPVQPPGRPRRSQTIAPPKHEEVITLTSTDDEVVDQPTREDHEEVKSKRKGVRRSAIANTGATKGKYIAVPNPPHIHKTAPNTCDLLALANPGHIVISSGIPPSTPSNVFALAVGDPESIEAKKQVLRESVEPLGSLLAEIENHRYSLRRSMLYLASQASSKRDDFPFALEYLVTCLQRDTLAMRDIYVSRVATSFQRAYGCSLDEARAEAVLMAKQDGLYESSLLDVDPDTGEIFLNMLNTFPEAARPHLHTHVISAAQLSKDDVLGLPMAIKALEPFLPVQGYGMSKREVEGRGLVGVAHLVKSVQSRDSGSGIQPKVDPEVFENPRSNFPDQCTEVRSWLKEDMRALYDPTTFPTGLDIYKPSGELIIPDYASPWSTGEFGRGAEHLTNETGMFTAGIITQCQNVWKKHVFKAVNEYNEVSITNDDPEEFAEERGGQGDPSAPKSGGSGQREVKEAETVNVGEGREGATVEKDAETEYKEPSAIGRKRPRERKPDNGTDGSEEGAVDSPTKRMRAGKLGIEGQGEEGEGAGEEGDDPPKDSEDGHQDEDIDEDEENDEDDEDDSYSKTSSKQLDRLSSPSLGSIPPPLPQIRTRSITRASARKLATSIPPPVSAPATAVTRKRKATGSSEDSSPPPDSPTAHLTSGKKFQNLALGGPGVGSTSTGTGTTNRPASSASGSKVRTVSQRRRTGV
ncbi:unnamed protein product [Rhizoctonia solani]|uniref:Uncharacterized protein n=1 Tax=Rhizoctonia solani TaxID=456999 RepID=A0A8H3H8U8_9AGAM|nr:unnamed protein product [Rhizoctonia solani]